MQTYHQLMHKYEGPSIINRLKNMVTPNNTGQQSQAPPLPDTPPANVQMASAATAKNPITNLTRIEEGVLSNPLDRAIARKT